MRFHEFFEFCDGMAIANGAEQAGEAPSADDLEARLAFHRAKGTPIVGEDA